MDLFSVGMLLPLFNRRGRALGASPSALGAIGSIYGCLQFFSGPYMGKVSDKWGRKPVLLLSFIGCLVGYFMMGVANTIFLFALARVPTGIFKHSQTSVKAYLSDITLPKERAEVLGIFNAVGSLGFIIAPIIGGTVAMHENGYFKVSLMTCSGYLFNFAFVWLVLENRKVKKKEEVKSSNNTDDLEIVDKISQSGSSVTRRKNVETATADLANTQQDHNGSTFSRFFSFFKIASVQNIVDILLIRFVMSLSMLIYRSNFTPMLDYRYGIDVKATGYIISYGSIAGALSGMSVGTIYSYIKNDGKMMTYASILMTISLFGITISPSIYTVLVCMAPLSLSTSIMRVISHNLMLKRIRLEEKGAVMGVGDSLTSIARMMSPAIAGFAQEVSVTGACWLSTCCGVAGITLGFVFKRLGQIDAAEKKTN